MTVRADVRVPLWLAFFASFAALLFICGWVAIRVGLVLAWFIAIAVTSAIAWLWAHRDFRPGDR